MQEILGFGNVDSGVAFGKQDARKHARCDSLQREFIPLETRVREWSHMGVRYAGDAYGYLQQKNQEWKVADKIVSTSGRLWNKASTFFLATKRFVVSAETEAYLKHKFRREKQLFLEPKRDAWHASKKAYALLSVDDTLLYKVSAVTYPWISSIRRSEELYPDDTFLKEDDIAHNLTILEGLSSAAITPAITTKAVYTSKPARSYVAEGYLNRGELQTTLAERTIVRGVGVAAGTAFLSIIKRVGDCIMETGQSAERCVGAVGTAWQGGSGKVALAAGGALFLGSLYFHYNGWLGKALHDPAPLSRMQNLDKVYTATASEFVKQLRKARQHNDLQTIDRLVRILDSIEGNISRLKLHLQADLNFNAEEAEHLAGRLLWACQEKSLPGFSISEACSQSENNIQVNHG